MVFSSTIFLCFFLPIMIIGYYILPKKLKNLYLLLGSLFFYAWGEPKYIFIMLASIAGNYCFGMLVHVFCSNPKLRKWMIVLTIIYNLGILFYFKYFVFAIESINEMSGAGLTVPEIVLPIGISFYTFQGMSYVIDVYREEGETDESGQRQSFVQKNPLNLALYISMFPQLIAGPIVRYKDIRDSLTNRVLNASRFASGIERFIIGLAKKAILANTIGEVADKIFAGDYTMMGTGTAWLGALCYTLQIYYDFSGYSDMAIGLGRIFGFDFMENFNYPYISRSITEFWRRWHISLSSWFRDYLYIPLGGNRKGIIRTYINLLIVFLATGFWHGAAWGFIIWGLWHGLFMVVERLLKIGKCKPLIKNVKLRSVCNWLYTMIVVMLGWVLFKTVMLEDALSYIGVMLHTHTPDYIAFTTRYYLDNKLIFMLVIAVIAALPWRELLPGRAGKLLNELNTLPAVHPAVIIRRILLIGLLIICMMFIMNNTYNPFIYFRF